MKVVRIEDAENYEPEKDWKRILLGEMVQETRKRETKTGGTIWLLVSYVPVKNSNNKKIQKIMILAQDISKEKIAEIELQKHAEALKQQEEKMRMNMEMLETTMSRMTMRDKEFNRMMETVDDQMLRRETDKDGKIIFVNSSFEISRFISFDLI